jgi:eukaryotic-like serine/threonine-protein kinase
LNVPSGDPLLGSTLDNRYQIVRRIARGGMATVFEAMDLRLSRTVAVKVMHPGLVEDGSIAARFDTEARAAALLSHPNVVAVFDQGHNEGRPYIVMEYVRGITLRQLITLEAPFPADQALRLFEPVVAALAAAHDAGIIHRDVKPENVLISEGGQVKVADFGLARDVTAATVAEGGVVIGTVSYIAPELVAHGHASPRSDVYSLGILLYELLTGVKPHRGSSPVEVAYAHVHKCVPMPSAAVPDGGVPCFLDALVQTTTTRAPEARQADAGVLLRQVRGARDAVSHGDAGSRALRALMSATTRDAAERAANRLPRLVGATIGRPALQAFGGPRPEPASTPPAPPTHTRTPPAIAGPLSPYSPPSRTSRVPRPTDWMQTPMHRRRRLATGAASVVVLAVLVFGGWWVTTGRLPAIPHTVGLDQSAASDALDQAGLTVQVIREFSDTVPAGVTTRSDPAEGARLAPGSVVIVYLSQGPQLFDVPPLKGKTRDEALAALADAGLSAGAITEEYDDRAPEGTVLTQGSAVGSGLRKGMGVDFVLSKGVEPVALDDWSNKPLAEAKQALTTAGFRVKVTEATSPSVPKGRVSSQTPAPGQLHKGDAVTLVVSSGPGLVTVPDVRKMDAASATASLQAAGFTVTVAAAPKAATVPGTVASTDPVVGRRIAAGSAITVYVG